MLIHSIDLSGGITAGFFTRIQEVTGNQRPVTKRLTEITIELFQNIRGHGTDLKDAHLSITKHPSGFTCRAVNTISHQEVAPLRQHINHINRLDPMALKKEHTKILGESRPAHTHHAGLGLYRIAMRSKSTLHVSFRQLDSKLFAFSLDVNLATHS